jgi:thioredoxin reductase
MSVNNLYNNIIIGAGTTGLQLAYFFNKHNIEYILLEKDSSAGSYYLNFPHSKKLLSINKNNSFKYDLYSLLNDEKFNFSDYSTEKYPNSEDYYNYLNDFSKKFNLNIKYNENVKLITKDDESQYIINTDNITYKCKNLYITTNFYKPKIPKCRLHVTKKENIKHYYDFSNNYFLSNENINKFKNKNVLFIGLGNSSMELSNLLYNYTKNIIIVGKSRSFSFQTDNDNDLKCKYLDFYDNSLFNGIVYDTINEKKSIIQCKDDNSENYGKYYVCEYNQKLYFNFIDYFDYIIYCTGYNKDISVFHSDLKIELNEHKNVINKNQNIYFFPNINNKKSKRHLIKELFYNTVLINVLKYDYFKFDGTLNIYDEITQKMFERINTSSTLFNLSNKMMDIFYYDSIKQEIIYYKNISSITKISKHVEVEFYCTLKFESKNENSPNFLQPLIKYPVIEIIKYNNKINTYTTLDKIIIEGNIISNFTNSNTYYNKIYRCLKYCPLMI